MSEALADTSVFLALEAGRPLRPFEGRLRISVATVTELEIGVLLASDAADRRRRMETLADARALVAIPYDEAVGCELARMIAELRVADRRVPFFDAVIAATATTTGLPVYTQDRDFELLRDHAGGPQVTPAWT